MTQYSQTCLQRPPIYNNHFLCFPWAVAIDRFECLTKQLRLGITRLEPRRLKCLGKSERTFETLLMELVVGMLSEVVILEKLVGRMLKLGEALWSTVAGADGCTLRW